MAHLTTNELLSLSYTLGFILLLCCGPVRTAPTAAYDQSRARLEASTTTIYLGPVVNPSTAPDVGPIPTSSVIEADSQQLTEAPTSIQNSVATGSLATGTLAISSDAQSAPSRTVTITAALPTISILSTASTLPNYTTLTVVPEASITLPPIPAPTPNLPGYLRTFQPAQLGSCADLVNYQPNNNRMRAECCAKLNTLSIYAMPELLAAIDGGHLGQRVRCETFKAVFNICGRPVAHVVCD